MVTKDAERSNNVRATDFPESTDIDMSFWNLSSGVGTPVCSLIHIRDPLLGNEVI